MRANHGPDYYSFKDWTATLLLKMKHREYIYFNLKGIALVINQPAFNLEDESLRIKIGRIFFEFRDRMMLIPMKCLNALKIDLKTCTQGAMGQLLKDFYLKYKLYTNVPGAELISFLESNNNLIL